MHITVSASSFSNASVRVQEHLRSPVQVCLNNADINLYFTYSEAIALSRQLRIAAGVDATPQTDAA